MAGGPPEAAWAELEALVGRQAVQRTAEALAWAARDAAGDYRLGHLVRRLAVPWAVVLPAGVEEVAEVVRWAGRWRVPLVPRGAGTGVMGGAAPLVPGVVVDLSRLDDVVVHPEDGWVEAGAGAVLSRVDAALRPHGLMLGHDPWSQGIATVGGAVGTDGLGYRGGRWGSMGDQVLAVEAVLGDGTVVRTRPVRGAMGPRSERLWAGAQGTLGIVTRVWIQAVPLPEAEGFVSFRWPGFDPAYRALLALWRTGVRYDLFDLTDAEPAALELDPGLEDGDGRTALVRLAAEGAREDVAARLAVARRVFAAHGGLDLGPEPAAAHWRARHRVAERYAEAVQGPRDVAARAREGARGFDYLNLALPPSRVPEHRRFCLERVAAAGGWVRAGDAGIWCRPEVFSLSLVEVGAVEPDAWAPEGRWPDRMEALLGELLRGALARGGSAECIHGAGVKLLPLLAEDLGPSLPLVRRLKAALDPAGLCNPGKLPGEAEG